MTAPRLSSLTYGSRTIGAGTTNVPDGQSPYRITSSFEEYIVEYDFIVTASLHSEIALLEDDFRKRRETLTLVYTTEGGTSTRIFSEGSGTGFEQRAELIKRGDTADTGNTRLYTARITVKLPADTSGDGGLLEATAELGYDGCRHASITISGVYTMTPGDDARGNYDSGIASLISSKISDVGESGSFNKLTEVSSQDDLNTRLEFRIELLKVEYAESSGAFDVSSIINQQMSVTRQEVSGEFSPVADATVQPPLIGTATYEACISLDVTSSLVSLWVGTILPWIAENIREKLDVGLICFTEATPTYDLPNNRITAVVAFEAFIEGAAFPLLQYNENTIRTLIQGKALVPVWTDATAFAKYVFQGPARELLKVVVSEIRIGLPEGEQFGFDFQTGRFSPDSIFGPGGSRQWVLVDDEENITPIRKGLPSEFCDTFQLVRSSTFERVDRVPQQIDVVT